MRRQRRLLSSMEHHLDDACLAMLPLPFAGLRVCSFNCNKLQPQLWRFSICRKYCSQIYRTRELMLGVATHGRHKTKNDDDDVQQTNDRFPYNNVNATRRLYMPVCLFVVIPGNTSWLTDFQSATKWLSMSASALAVLLKPKETKK